ncbi:MAG: NUDIX hydrolase [Patescibacteria group bacterium]
MPNVIIVNEKDEIIEYKPRNEKLPTDISRVAGLVIFNSNNEMLLGKRVMTKKNDPGKWDLAVAGTVEEGETYESNIVKEAQEEIGLCIKESDLKFVLHTYQETSFKYFSTVFSVIADKPITEFKKEDEEVEEIRWVNMNELREWYKNTPEDFIPTFGYYVNIKK